jgi:hypothetical protein
LGNEARLLLLVLLLQLTYCFFNVFVLLLFLYWAGFLSIEDAVTHCDRRTFSGMLLFRELDTWGWVGGAVVALQNLQTSWT